MKYILDFIVLFVKRLMGMLMMMMMMMMMMMVMMLFVIHRWVIIILCSGCELQFAG